MSNMEYRKYKFFIQFYLSVNLQKEEKKQMKIKELKVKNLTQNVDNFRHCIYFSD